MINCSKANVYLNNRELELVITALEKEVYSAICTEFDNAKAKELTDLEIKLRVILSKELDKNA